MFGFLKNRHHNFPYFFSTPTSNFRKCLLYMASQGEADSYPALRLIREPSVSSDLQLAIILAARQTAWNITFG